MVAPVRQQLIKVRLPPAIVYLESLRYPQRGGQGVLHKLKFEAVAKKKKV